MQAFLSFFKRIHILMSTAETGSTRLWLGIAAIIFGWVCSFSYMPHHSNFEYTLMSVFMPLHYWGALFLIHGLSLIFGVLYHKTNTFLLFTECILGIVLWWVTATSFSFEQRIVSPVWICALISFWLLTRYPTKTNG